MNEFDGSGPGEKVDEEQSSIDHSLIAAYLETEYCVTDPSAFTLKVGQPNSDLLATHHRHQVKCSAFLTAWNPYSEHFDPAKNADRQADLERELLRRDLIFLSGIGQHPSNGWEGEESFLIFGLDLDSARQLGRQFRQNGFIWSGADGIPQLILLR